ncbi:aspartate-semialdehyde dehydrogenase [soil metagenome]
MKVVLVGATGAVGEQILAILEERRLPVDELVAVASARSVGRRLAWRGSEVEVAGLESEVFDGADIALFDVADELSRDWAPRAAGRGTIVIDNSAAWRMDPDVPLVVPEINPEQAANRPKGIIASANCTTLSVVVPLAALHRVAGLRRLVLASYQAASGAGRPGIEELWEQTQSAVKQPDEVTAGLGRDALGPGGIFGHPLALNVLPQCGSVKGDGYTSEEIKLCEETRKILGISDLPVTATCVRVPVFVGHSVAVHAEFQHPITAAQARVILSEAPGV